MIARAVLVWPMLLLLAAAGCDSNPEAPRAPAVDRSAEPAGLGSATRRPLTKNAKEIVNPD